ncbi:hypothetical protein [Metapseudomonas otitidis]|uniref:hypothetical protein n=1 Tax=Metapseudomonas otitidis TaxID=319939 RepID=UPI0008E19B8A|nr:hypothetical protein [Pseudomonas otitidis]SFA66547.1 hypothetical protein SAMN05216263_12241 [Pseudomonas otitidis]
MSKGMPLALLAAALLSLAGCDGGTPPTEQAQASAPAPTQAASALKASQFSDVAAMIEDMADYSAEDGTFALLAAEPLHIRLAPRIIKGEPAENLQSEQRRAALYGVYRTLIHTPAQAVTVTVVPMLVTINPSKYELQKSPQLVVSATREQALAAVRSLVPAEQLSDLVVPEQAGEIQLDNWRKDFEKVYFGDAGQAELLKALSAAGAKVQKAG